MNNKEIVNRLKSIIIDIETNINCTTNQLFVNEWKKDLTAIKETVNILVGDNNDSKTID